MTEIDRDKIIDYFLKNSKSVGKPYIWVNKEEKEEIRRILEDSEDDTTNNKQTDN